MAVTYAEFLDRRRLTSASVGREIDIELHPRLFPFQAAIVRWAARKGRAAVFADTGLGKTMIQLEWARALGERTLIVAPLSVARQTIREAAKIGLSVTYSRDGRSADGITITNYEMVERFDPAAFGAVVLDESSILKALDGKTRKRLTEMFSATPLRLACTATPAPNDLAEIGNHAEFLGIMSHREMLSAFFVHGSDDSGKDGWRLKGHAEDAFFRWLASWGMAVRTPSDIGFADDGYVLPPLTITPQFIPTDYVPEGQLFFGGLKGISDRVAVRRQTMEERCAVTGGLVNATDDQWLVWHGLNDEGHRLAALIPGAVLVEGNQSPDAKAAAMEAFQDGRTRVLISKPTICGFGMNFQNAHRMAFVGLSDSWEQYYQAIRRSWRFGQTQPVEAHIVLSDAEAAIFENVMGKEREAKAMQARLIEHVAGYEREELSGSVDGQTYATDETDGGAWRMLLGDSTERLAEIGRDSVDMSMFSSPFLSLFTYSPSERDLGNATSEASFYEHFRFIVDELRRVTKPGRLCVVHVQQVTTTVAHDGVTGQRDFRGDVIRLYVDRGWVFHGEVVIDKDPQAQAIRTKSKALLFVQKERDRSWLRPALADYLLVFRAPGENAVPIREDQITNEEWIEWARPIWYGIRESATLNAAEAREEKDERHIAALQLETVRRAIRLWSNPGELVLDPFAGIGTTGYVAVNNDRQFVGIELKRSYYEAACRNISRAVGRVTLGLF